MPGVLQHQGFVYSLPCPRVSQEYNSNRVLCTLCPFRGCARRAIAIGFCVLFALFDGVLGVLQQLGFVYSLPCPRVCQEYYSNRVLCILFALSYQSGQSFIFNPWSFRDTHSTCIQTAMKCCIQYQDQVYIKVSHRLHLAFTSLTKLHFFSL